MTERTYAKLVKENVDGNIEYYLALTTFNSDSEPRKEKRVINGQDYEEIKKDFLDAMNGKGNDLSIPNSKLAEPVSRGEIIESFGFLEIVLVQ